MLNIRDANGNFIKIPVIKGEKGDKGDKGDTPVKGTDYFTADDINTIVNAVYAKVADGTEVAY